MYSNHSRCTHCTYIDGINNIMITDSLGTDIFKASIFRVEASSQQETGGYLLAYSSTLKLHVAGAPKRR
jgi:hypothetical protein